MVSSPSRHNRHKAYQTVTSVTKRLAGLRRFFVEGGVASQTGGRPKGLAEAYAGASQ